MIQVNCCYVASSYSLRQHCRHHDPRKDLVGQREFFEKNNGQTSPGSEPAALKDSGHSYPLSIG